MKELRKLYNYLNKHLYEREEVIEGIFHALGAKVHIMLLGPPGTSKSLAAKAVATALDMKYFSRLMNPFLTPENFLGPLDIQGIKNGVYQHVTANTMAEAEIAFLDEIFKANGAVNNLLLTILNEREADIGASTPVKVPLQFAMLASNELPSDDEQSVQFAFVDRLLLRYVVDYIKAKDGFVSMIGDSNDIIGNVPHVSKDEILAYQKAVERVNMPPEVLMAVADIRARFARESRVYSDRRYKEGLKVVKARAAFEGRKTAELGDLEVYRNILWDEPGQRPLTNRIVLEVADPILQEIEELFLSAQEIAEAALKSSEENASDIGIEANAKLKDIATRLNAQQPTSQRGKDKLTEAQTRVQTWIKEVLEKCLGVQL